MQQPRGASRHLRPRAAQPAPAAAPSPDKPVVVPFPVAPNSTLPVAGPPPADTGVPATVPAAFRVHREGRPAALAAVAYPDFPLRGIKFGSLWLTFHGLQWPYMPSSPTARSSSSASRAGAGSTTRTRSSGPGAPTRSFDAEQHQVLEGSRPACCSASRRRTRSTDEHFIQGQVELVGTGDQTIAPQQSSAAPTPTTSGSASANGTAGTSRSAASKAGRSFTSAWASTSEHLRAQRRGRRRASLRHLVLRPDRQPVPPGRRGRERRVALLSAAVPALRAPRAWRAASAGPPTRARPVGILDLGWVKLKVGTEYQQIGTATPATDNTHDHVERRRRRPPVRLRAPRRVRRERRAGHRADIDGVRDLGPRRQLHAHEHRRVRERLERRPAAPAASSASAR